MIRYHGGPITPDEAAMEAWRDGHACVSFANQQQVELAFEIAAEVFLDNGAYSLWGKGERIDVAKYIEFVDCWKQHPAFGWCVIPDVIDGTEQENLAMIEQWPLQNYISVPVWHLHESLDFLGYLVDSFPRVAIGSSGQYSDPGTDRWWGRIAEAMEISCDVDGYPKTRLHGLRQMDNNITSRVPYSSVDSCNIARNVGIDSAWTGRYVPASKKQRAAVLRDRIAHHATASRWKNVGCYTRNGELFG